MTNIIMETKFNHTQHKLTTMPVAARKDDDEANELVIKLIAEQQETAQSPDSYSSFFIVSVDDEDEAV
jgi:hypothetical protein